MMATAIAPANALDTKLGHDYLYPEPRQRSSANDPFKKVSLEVLTVGVACGVAGEKTEDK